MNKLVLDMMMMHLLHCARLSECVRDDDDDKYS